MVELLVKISKFQKSHFDCWSSLQRTGTFEVKSSYWLQNRNVLVTFIQGDSRNCFLFLRGKMSENEGVENTEENTKAISKNDQLKSYILRKPLRQQISTILKSNSPTLDITLTNIYIHYVTLTFFYIKWKKRRKTFICSPFQLSFSNFNNKNCSLVQLRPENIETPRYS